MDFKCRLLATLLNKNIQFIWIRTDKGVVPKLRDALGGWGYYRE